MARYILSPPIRSQALDKLSVPTMGHSLAKGCPGEAGEGGFWQLSQEQRIIHQYFVKNRLQVGRIVGRLNERIRAKQFAARDWVQLIIYEEIS